LRSIRVDEGTTHIKDETMKYLCLAYEEENKLNALSRSEWGALRGEALAYLEELRNRGHMISAEALQSARNASTIRVRGGKVTITDGPFAETKETLGGFFLIDARDLNEAIQVASKWPSARLGSIEVRPIEEELREESRYGQKQQEE
jgi:hypothetical protein